MALFNEAWFVHALNENVTHLAEQKKSKVRGAIRTKEGVVGKTYPFNTIGSVDMSSATRDADTTYLNPDQAKRRAILRDFNAAVLIDDFDKVKELANPDSEFAMALVRSRERKLDDLVLGIDAATVGGIGGLATTVDEAAETTGTVALSAETTDFGSTTIANGGTGMTLAKILDTKLILDTNNVDEEDRYFFYSPMAMRKMLAITEVTNSDFNTVKALAGGGFPMDQQWMGFYWRQSTRLPKSGNIRTCFALQKQAVGLAIGLITEVKVNEAPHKWNNTQVVIKLSAGAVRIDGSGVVGVDIDESV